MGHVLRSLYLNQITNRRKRHVVHNQFNVGLEFVTFDLKSFMNALHRIFLESPSYG